ncbi:MAG: hypothetical protein V7K21_10545 [Nostoc sp.]
MQRETENTVFDGKEKTCFKPIAANYIWKNLQDRSSGFPSMIILSIGNP